MYFVFDLEDKAAGVDEEDLISRTFPTSLSQGDEKLEHKSDQWYSWTAKWSQCKDINSVDDTGHENCGRESNPERKTSSSFIIPCSFRNYLFPTYKSPSNFSKCTTSTKTSLKRSRPSTTRKSFTINELLGESQVGSLVIRPDGVDMTKDKASCLDKLPRGGAVATGSCLPNGFISWFPDDGLLEIKVVGLGGI